MRSIQSCILALSLAVLAAMPTAALAYGGGGGGAPSCEDPIFFELEPDQDSTVAPFTEFSLTASSDTDPATLEVKVNGQPVEFTTEQKRSGHHAVHARLAQTLAPGRARIHVYAKAKDPDCSKLFVYYVNVRAP